MEGGEGQSLLGRLPSQMQSGLWDADLLPGLLVPWDLGLSPGCLPFIMWTEWSQVKYPHLSGALRLTEASALQLTSIQCLPSAKCLIHLYVKPGISDCVFCGLAALKPLSLFLN